MTILPPAVAVVVVEAIAASVVAGDMTFAVAPPQLSLLLLPLLLQKQQAQATVK